MTRSKATLLTYFILALSVAFFQSIAYAQITVDTVIFNFKPGQRPVSNVVVKNNGEDALFVEVDSLIVNSPGTDNEERVPTTHLVASPKRFSIEPKGERTVRILLKKKLGEEEQVYRVRFIPRSKSLDVEEKKGGRNAMVKIVTGVGILIFGQPVEPKVEISWSRSKDSITFENKGNTNALLQDIKICDSAESETCKNTQGFRLYPGLSRSIKGVGGKTLKMKKEVLQEFEELVIEP